MKKALLTFAVAAVILASCKKLNYLTPTTSTETANTSAFNSTKHGRADYTAIEGNTDDNQPKQSGNDEKNITVPAKVATAFSQNFPGSIAKEWKCISRSSP